MGASVCLYVCMSGNVNGWVHATEKNGCRHLIFELLANMSWLNDCDGLFSSNEKLRPGVSIGRFVFGSFI